MMGPLFYGENLAPALYWMSTSIAHFVAFEVGNLIEALTRLGLIATVGLGAVIAVLRVETVIDVAVEALRTMKPRAGANEYAAGKPLRTVVAVRRAVVGRNVIVAIRALGRDSDADTYLGLGLGSSGCKAKRSNRS